MNFAESPSLEREQAILDAIRSGKGQVEWYEIVLSPELTIEVSNPVTIDGVRIVTTARTAQYIGDYYDASLWTRKISDIAYENSTIKLPPYTQDPCTGLWSHALRHSAIIETIIGGRPGLVCNQGKQWVICKELWKRPFLAALYGWYVPESECKYNPKTSYTEWKGIKTYPCVVKSTRVIQPMALSHNCGASKVLGHVDYSMFDRYWRAKNKTTKEVLADSALVSFVSDEGVLPDSRHPGVPKDTSWIGQS